MGSAPSRPISVNRSQATRGVSEAGSGRRAGFERALGRGHARGRRRRRHACRHPYVRVRHANRFERLGQAVRVGVRRCHQARSCGYSASGTCAFSREPDDVASELDEFSRLVDEPEKQVEHDGQYNGSDYGEDDHHETASCATERPYPYPHLARLPRPGRGATPPHPRPQPNGFAPRNGRYD